MKGYLNTMVESPNGTTAQGDARGQRLQRLRRAIAQNGTLHLKDAAQLLNVSEMTVRRDLTSSDATLACLGGYVVNAASPTAVKYTLEQEIDQHTQDKRFACHSAADRSRKATRYSSTVAPPCSRSPNACPTGCRCP